MTSLPCGTIIYRSVHRTHLDADGNVTEAAFLLSPQDEGLSAWLDNQSAWSRRKRVRAVRTLHVGRRRDEGLTVMADKDDPDHSEVVGLPNSHTDPAAVASANKWARRLLGMSRPAPEP